MPRKKIKPTRPKLQDAPSQLPKSPSVRLGDNDKVVILGGGPAGCAAAMYLKKMQPTLDVMVLDNRNEKVMSTGGPGSCKGCVGGISGFLLDLLHYDFGIKLPDYLINNYIRRVKFINLLDEKYKRTFEIDLAKDLADYWALPANDSVLVSVGNGKGNYRHPQGKSISFDYFLRTKAKEMGARFEYGFVNEVLIPHQAENKVIVRYSKKRLKSTIGWYQKDSTGKLIAKEDDQARKNQDIDDAALVINATGLNSRNRLKLSVYSQENEEKDLQPLPVPDRAIGKVMGIFDIDIRRDILERKFGNCIRVYGGIPGVNAVVAAPKYLQEGGSWLTLGILLDRDVKPQYDNLSEQEQQSTAKPSGLRHEMKSIRNEFLRRSGLQKYLVEKSMSKISCRCTPIIPQEVAGKPYGHRYIEVGDISGAMKYGRNGIPYAIISAKRAVKAAIRYGITEQDFKLHYEKKFVRTIKRDNVLGKYIVKLNYIVNRYPLLVDMYYNVANHSPWVKRYATQILLGIRRSDNYTNSTLQLLKSTYGGIGLLVPLIKLFMGSLSKNAKGQNNGATTQNQSPQQTNTPRK